MDLNSNDQNAGINVDGCLNIGAKKYTKAPDAFMIYLNGYIDTYNTEKLHTRITGLIDSGAKNLIFDCRDLTYLSSTGVGSFISFLKLVKKNGGELIFFNMRKEVHDVIKILGFSHIFTILDTEEGVNAYFTHDSDNSFVFPAVISCPACNKSLKAPHAGRFRCVQCRNVLSVSASGVATLG